jgi:uncharacterized RDD family membrane protein YckC
LRAEKSFVRPLFDGPSSLRHPRERLAFWLTLLLAIPAAPVLGFFVHETIGASTVALFIVGAMIYVTLARGRLIGSSVMIHETQYPRVFAIVKKACATLEIPMPVVFVREDNFVPVAALGFGEPYALIISGHWIETFRDDELAFMIGRELGHIAAGHTRLLSLLSVNGRENPIVAIVFGAWLRRCTLTCDKVGLLCCGTLDAAIRAIAVAEFHEFGRRIDYAAFAEQGREIESDSILRWGVWLGSEPYATVRIASLRMFMTSHAYAVAEEWFLRDAPSQPPALPEPGTATVLPGDCAGWWRRLAAFALDLIIVSAIISAFGGSVIHYTNTRPKPGINVSYPGQTAAPAPAATPPSTFFGPIRLDKDGPHLDAAGVGLQNVAGGINSARALFWLPLYLFVLVAVAGQTFGMMIAGLRVVTVDFRKPGFWRTLLRYAIVAIPGLGPVSIALLSFIWRRVLLHDRWSGTRVVKVERVLARVTPASE